MATQLLLEIGESRPGNQAGAGCGSAAPSRLNPSLELAGDEGFGLPNREAHRLHVSRGRPDVLGVGQGQEGARMAGGQGLLRDKVLDILWQREKAQCVGNGRTVL